VWNTVPGMFAGLVTGNAVIVKPHPGAVYPIAIVVGVVQHVLQQCGLDPMICQLAVDTFEKPATLDLVQHPAVRVIDYTGGPHFGSIVEREAAAHGKVVFTEKAGVNTVILDSTDNIDKTMSNLAFSLSLYGGQMCTAPQNIFIPRDGMLVNGERMSVEDVTLKLREHIDALVGNEKAGPSTVGTIQNAATLSRVWEAQGLGLPVVRESAPLPQPGFADARSVSPLVLRTDKTRVDIYEREWFGPISFVITVDSFEDALGHVVRSVREHGALTSLVYCTDADKMQQAEDAIIASGAPVAFNFNSFVWVNQSAAFSDFHGAGCNPAGNATFADWSFVTNRYNVVGVRKQA
jgi:phenylacetic acid degradation protein paaN